MKRLLSLLIAAALAAPIGAAASPLAGGEAKVESTFADAVLFVGGGTNVTNGVFFPGTSAKYDDQWIEAPPLQVEQGSNITLVNEDPGVVTNCHRVVSFKRKKKTQRPLFQSPDSCGPSQTQILTQHLKPGIYRYFCSTHFGMFGRIEIVAP